MARGTAMARLVSIPVSLAVEGCLARDVAAGVSAATVGSALGRKVDGESAKLAQQWNIVDQNSCLDVSR